MSSRAFAAILLAALGGLASAQAIFSEYVEGTGLNKALEILNVSGGTLDLSRCRVEMYFNGQQKAELVIDLVGRIGPGQVHVLYHDDEGRDYDEAFVRATRSASSRQPSGFGWFNGNDAVILRCNGTVVDSLGQIGSDSYWGRDMTLRRIEGSGDTNPNDDIPIGPGWVRLEKNTFDGLGHP